MKVMWCWRCKTDVAMLDDDEARIAYDLYGQGIKALNGTLEQRCKPLLDYYFKVTGERETNPNAVMHHLISIYGPLCENCGKPYRTSKASFCAACGNKRVDNS